MEMGTSVGEGRLEVNYGCETGRDQSPYLQSNLQPSDAVEGRHEAASAKVC